MADEIKKLNVSQAPSPITGGTGATTLDSDAFADIKDQLVARYELLPDELKTIITDDAFRVKLFEIAKELKMTYEELGTLEIETTMVILGMTRPEEYRDELQIQLKKNDADIDNLVGKVNAQVFAPIRASLEKLYASKKNPEDFFEAPPAPTTPEVKPEVAPATASVVPTKTPATGLTDAEKTVLAKTGVVLSETPSGVMKAPSAPLSSRTNILAGIENPASLKTNIVSEKLNSSAPVIPTNKATDYSIPKTTPPSAPSVTPAPKADPYREPLN